MNDPSLEERIKRIGLLVQKMAELAGHADAGDESAKHRCAELMSMLEEESRFLSKVFQGIANRLTQRN